MIRRIGALVDSVRDGTILRECLLVMILGAFALLLVEVRFEHRIVVTEKWQAWIPIAYFATMCLLIPTALLFLKRKFTVRILTGAFVIGMLMGGLGSWFHTKGEPLKRVMHVVKADLAEPGHLMADDEGPPPLAPLAVSGLSLIGVLVCLFTPPSARPRQNE